MWYGRRSLFEISKETFTRNRSQLHGNHPTRCATVMLAAWPGMIHAARQHSSKGSSTSMADNESIAGSFEALKDAFQPDKTMGVNKTINFEFRGREPGQW